MKKLILLSLLSIGLFSACKDREADPNVLPEATQSGKNTGGALVDGKVWVAKIAYPDLNGGGVNATMYEHANGKYKMKIVFQQANNINNRIVIYISDVDEIVNRIYKLDNNNVAGYEKGLDYLQYYTTNTDFDGSITFSKFDKINKIASGTFNFKAKNSAGQVVTITDGRFDKRFL
ncbi:hypothetical protein Q73A0000_11820 [Kaistella flava (ex Peng et al. 2021)]|uniref:Lipoprotein n=1 Tax=Kaistella flava (ex Peng et al. 2021) TaxID=2038776 RepID=A0A7M2YA62_9FLAO|nr:DUF6252 family protein [Kaistella flava (ex Peng et al. 2021)]QOW10996.1 hypothetical protein Q73A0000_11820 [Kaistella flava (ex Peng et al. 2021)]